MHAWIRSTLILVVALGSVCLTAWAEDVPAESALIDSPPVATSAPVPVAEADRPTSGAAILSKSGVIEDDEASTAVPPGEPLSVEPQPAVEEPAARGPKTSSDKLVEKFMTLDVDASNGVSMDEYITMVQQRVMARFAAMDADGNGEVTEDEYRVFWKTRMAKWYRLKR